MYVSAVANHGLSCDWLLAFKYYVRRGGVQRLILNVYSVLSSHSLIMVKAQLRLT